MPLFRRIPPPSSAVETSEEAPVSSISSAASSSSSTTNEDLGYNTAGGGTAAFQATPHSFFTSMFAFLYEEAKRPSRDPVLVRGPDLHQRLPVWMEDKDVNIMGEKLSEKELEDAGRWRGKYKKELEIADAVVRVKSQRIRELDHDLFGSFRQLRRWLGYEPPLDEKRTQREAEAQWEAKMRGRTAGSTGRPSSVEGSEEGEKTASSFRGPQEGEPHSVNASSSSSSTPGVPTGVLVDGPVERRLETAWEVFLTTAKTGRPLAQVAAEYRPHVDFYGLDAFLDSPLSLIWFWTKIGMFIGLGQGTARAAQAISSDLSYLRASGVGVLSVLNLSAFAGVVKWGGNFALLGTAFCVGDAMVTGVRSLFLPHHELRVGGKTVALHGQRTSSVARRTRTTQGRMYRTTSNYVGGCALAGGMVGVMPWWILQDNTLAWRLCLSGVCVGSGLGLVVGMLLQRMVALNLSRLDASPRHFRRYEALLLRQRDWVEGEVRASQKNAIVWW